MEVWRRRRVQSCGGLKLEEREEISVGLGRRSVVGSPRSQRSPSTISREIETAVADLPCKPGREERWERALRLSLVAWRSMGSYDGAWRRSLRCNGRQSRSGWLKQQFRPTETWDISRSDLSQSLCSDARRAEEGADGTVAYKAADASRQRRQGQEWTGAHTRYGLYPRETRRGRGSRVPGHWEGDLLTGASDTHIVTLVERHSRFTMLVKLPRKDTTTVVAALAKHIRKLPEQLRRSLTWDQARRCLATNASRLPPTCRFTSVIRAVHGSVAATRTPTACCDSTSREEPISRASPSLPQWHCSEAQSTPAKDWLRNPCHSARWRGR